MIAKAPEIIPEGIENSVVVWLPYMGNLALAKALVATTTSEKPLTKGVEPIKKEGKGVQKWEKDKGTTLRIVVDLWLIAESRLREHLKQHPHTALHQFLAGSECKEVKTHGWVIGDNLSTGYCTVSEKDAEVLLQLSGNGGVFVTRLQQDITEKPPVTWAPLESGESVLKYHERVMATAKKYAVPAESCVADYGGAIHMGPTSVRDWLTSIGWVVESTPRAPNFKFRSWSFQGRNEETVTQKHYAYELTCGSSTCHLTIKRWQKKRIPSAEEKEKEHRVRGTKWWSADQDDPVEDMITPTLKYESEVAATKLDTQEDDDMKGAGESEGGSKREQENKEGSPPAKKTKKGKAPEVALQGGSMGPEGSTLIDLGWAGDCGWRALSVMVAAHNAKDFSKLDDIISQVETLSTTLRAKTINFLTVNFQKWQKDWIPDPLASNTTEGGPPAKDIQTFLKEVLPRPNRWVCGLGLAGVSLMQCCTVVVWQFHGGPQDTHRKDCWKRAAVIRGRKDSSKQVIVPVVLHHGHYFALRPPALRKGWPKEWAVTQAEEKEIAVSQELDNTQVLAPVCRGGGRDPLTTPVKVKPNKDDNDEMLRTCSSKEEALSLLRPCSRAASRHTLQEDLLRTCSTKASRCTGVRWTCPICEETMDCGEKKEGFQQGRFSHATSTLGDLARRD